jgi:hypothetical protein
MADFTRKLRWPVYEGGREICEVTLRGPERADDLAFWIGLQAATAIADPIEEGFAMVALYGRLSVDSVKDMDIDDFVALVGACADYTERLAVMMGGPNIPNA